MFAKLLLLFITIPLLEMWLLIEIGKRIGTLNTIAIVIITGLAGAWLARSQGAQIIRNIQAELQIGRIPSEQLIDGLLILIGGVLLLTPGLLTDIAGLLFLIPLTRRLFKQIIKKQFDRYIQKNSRVEFYFHDEDDF